MANDLNRWEGIGRLGKPPESVFFAGGGQVTKFSIACGAQWKDKTSGDKKESTEWVNIEVFGKLAEICAQYLDTGSRIYLSGRLQTDKWEDKDGNNRYTTKIVGDQMQMLDAKGDREASSSSQQSRSAPTQSHSAPPSDAYLDDIPF